MADNASCSKFHNDTVARWRLRLRSPGFGLRLISRDLAPTQRD
jgi:hypothetical protein